MQDDVNEQIVNVGPWFHNIEITPGVYTRQIAPSPGPQPNNHPLARWQVFENEFPRDLSGARVLDIGCADGFFSIELAKRGARVVAQDAARKMIDRLNFAASKMGYSSLIDARVGGVEDLDVTEKFDFVVFLGLLYHLKHPFLGLEKISKLSDKVYLESAVDLGAEPYMYLKPPQEGVHYIPKWFPTKSCIVQMLKFVDFTNIQELDDPTRGRASMVAMR